MSPAVVHDHAFLPNAFWTAAYALEAQPCAPSNFAIFGQFWREILSFLQSTFLRAVFRVLQRDARVSG